MRAFPAGVTFFSGKKETHERKLPWGRERAERSSGRRFAGPFAFDLWAGGYDVGWLVLAFVRQQLHALLERFLASTVLAFSCLFSLVTVGIGGD